MLKLQEMNELANKSVGIVLEWENAQSLEREEALGFLRDLLERIKRANLAIAKPITLILVFDEEVDQSELRNDLLELAPEFGHDLEFELLFAPGTAYYAKKGVVPFMIKKDIYVYADSDCVYSEDWLTDLLTPVLNNDVAMCYGDTVAQKGENFVERACSIAWFFPLESPKDPLRKKGKNRFFANNFAADGDVMRQVPIIQHSGSRSHGAIWVKDLAAAGMKIRKVQTAIASHKQYGDFSSFFHRAWVFGLDKDVAFSVANASRLYRIRRALTAVFELHGKYQARFFKLAPSFIPALEWLPCWLMGIAFQVTANAAQLLSSLFMTATKFDEDYSTAVTRASIVTTA